MNFSEDKIIEIYNKFVKKDINYFNETITDVCPVKKWNNSWRFKDAPRCKCVLDFINWINKYNISNCDMLGYTSEDDPEIEFINAKKKKFYICIVKMKLLKIKCIMIYIHLNLIIYMIFLFLIKHWNICIIL